MQRPIIKPFSLNKNAPTMEKIRIKKVFKTEKIAYLLFSRLTLKNIICKSKTYCKLGKNINKNSNGLLESILIGKITTSSKNKIVKTRLYTKPLFKA